MCGARRMCSRIGALLVAVAISTSYKPEVRVLLSRHYPLALFIRETINRRMATPVSGISLKADQTLPLFINQLYMRHGYLPAGGGTLFDLTCQAILNVICFSLACLAWGCTCYVVSSVWLKRRPIDPGRVEKWGGLIMGAVGAALTATLAFGIILPLLALLTPNSLGFEHSALFQLMWSVVDRTGIWWN